MAAEAPVQPPAAAGEPNHGLRIFIPWFVLSLAADLIIWLVWRPHLPPGAMSSAAANQQFDIAIMAVLAAPVMILVLTYFGYALIVWRHREGDEGRMHQAHDRQARFKPPPDGALGDVARSSAHGITSLGFAGLEWLRAWTDWRADARKISRSSPSCR